MFRKIFVSASLIAIASVGALSIRNVFANPPSAWQNPGNPLDVNHDGQVTIVDATIVTEAINATGMHPLTDPFPAGGDYLDTDGDGQLSPADVNRINTFLNAAATPTPSATPAPTNVTCQLMVDPQSNFLEQYMPPGAPVAGSYLSEAFRPVEQSGVIVFPTTRYADRVIFRVYCKRATTTGATGTTPVAMKFTLNTSLIPGHCKTNTNNLCVEAFQFGSSDAVWEPGTAAGTVNVTDTYSTTPSAVLFLRNRSNAAVTIAGTDIKAETDDGAFSFPLGATVKVEAIGDVSCTVAVSGASGPISSMPCPAGSCDWASMGTTNVENGQIQFDVIIQGAPGQMSTPKNVTWDPTGSSGISSYSSGSRWDNPTVETVNNVTATVTTQDNKTLTCGIKVYPLAVPKYAQISKAGDCELFDDLRRHYFTTTNSQGVSTARTAAYSPALYYPNLKDFTFGALSPEIPFRGFMDAWADASGKIKMGVNGAISLPADRPYNSPVLAVTPYDPGITDADPFGEPVLWAQLSSSNWSDVKLVPTGRPFPGNVRAEDYDGYVVFRIFLPHRIPDTAVTTNVPAKTVYRAGAYRTVPASSYTTYSGEKRGKEGEVQMWSFSPGLKDAFVPFVNTSCIEMFRVSPPQLPDQPVGNAMKNTPICMNSRPWKYADVKSGRAKFEVLASVPTSATSEFPTDFLRNSNSVPCVASSPNITSKCVAMDASQLPPTDSAAPPEAASNADCQYVEYIQHTGKALVYKNQTIDYTYAVPVTKFKPGCRVIEGSGCGANMAIRFSGYTQMMLASLGCFWKYQKSPAVGGRDLSGVSVSATLYQEGILPYTTAAGQGGANPASYTGYPASKLDPKLGYGCIPCRFEGIGTLTGFDLHATTKPLPVDQERCPEVTSSKASPTTTLCDPSSGGRPPVYAFNMSTAATECLDGSDHTGASVSLRYFGSAECNGVNTPPGHFCSSNIPPRSCPGNSEMVNKDIGTTSPNLVEYTFGGTGNTAGSYKVPLCPLSKLPFDSVSASWSPLIVDMTGTGIGISRTFAEAKLFDIKGTGQKTLIDWPTTTKRTPFLVRPTNGKVTSIKELFGDYKAANGFEALRALDSNKDGKVDARDKEFGTLALWFDTNRDAVAQPREIQTLKKHGVLAIYLNYKKPKDKGIEGKTLTGYYLASGSRKFRAIEDHYFFEYWKGGKRVANLKIPGRTKKF